MSIILSTDVDKTALQTEFESGSKQLDRYSTKIESKTQKIAQANQAHFQATFLGPKKSFVRWAERISGIFSWTSYFLDHFFKHPRISFVKNPQLFAYKVAYINWKITQFIFHKLHGISFFDFLNVGFETSFIKQAAKKETQFDEILKKNLQKLAQYDQNYKECERKCTQYCEMLGLSTSYQEMKAELIANGKDLSKHEFVEASPCIKLTKIIPYGMVLDSKLIEMRKRAQQIFEKAIESTDVRCLYIEAMAQPHPSTNITGSWELVFATKAENESLEFGAFCNSALRLICLDEAVSDEEALSSFIFELTNAASSQRFSQIYDLAINGKISREEYAKTKEAIEHEGSLRHCFIMLKAIEQLGWCSSFATEYFDRMDFETVWPLTQNSRHTEAYREQWDSIQLHSTNLIEPGNQAQVTSNVSSTTE